MPMLRKYCSFVLLLCFLTVAGFSQKNLREAIVVLNNADTTNGFIDYKEWFSNPASVLFTTGKNIATTRYTVAELNYFEIVGLVRYQRHTIKVSLSNDAISNTGSKDTSSETRTVFLKIVEEGKPLTLFSYRDDLKQRLYVQDKNDTAPQELLNSVYMLNGQVLEEKQYRTDLTNWAIQYRAGDSRILSRISGMGYYTNDIADICRQIDGSTRQVVKRAASLRSGPAFRIFAGGGIGQGAIKITGGDRFAGINSHPFYSPLADIGIDLMLNPNVGKVVFRMQLHIADYKTDAYVFRDFAQYTEEYFLTFKQRNISVTPQFLYNIYNKKQLKWFAAAGISINFSSYPENKEYAIRKSSSDVSDYTDNSYLKFMRSAWLNFCFNTGVSINRFELSAVYNPTASISSSTGYGVDNSSLQLRLNFYIKK